MQSCVHYAIDVFTELLWTSPELLQQSAARNGSKAGDVYAMAVIMQEVFYRCMPYAHDDLDPAGQSNLT